MENLDELLMLRKTIDSIDQEMAILFEKRMDIVKRIAQIKNRSAMNIEDKDREKTMLANNQVFLKNEEYVAYYHDFLKKVIELSKKLQEKSI